MTRSMMFFIFALALQTFAQGSDGVIERLRTVVRDIENPAAELRRIYEKGASPGVVQDVSDEIYAKYFEENPLMYFLLRDFQNFENENAGARVAVIFDRRRATAGMSESRSKTAVSLFKNHCGERTRVSLVPLSSEELVLVVACGEDATKCFRIEVNPSGEIQWVRAKAWPLHSTP